MSILDENELLLYVILGMLCTWFVQINSRKYKLAPRFERVRNSFVCSLFTAAICIPMLEYFATLPPSLSLLVGVVVGTLGIDGWDRLISIALDLVQSKADSMGRWRSSQPYHRDTDDDEPPMPTRRKRP